jgi:amino-acid N-acetyltransferase
VRPARTADVESIRRIVEPLVQGRVLLGRDRVAFYESVQEFHVAEGPDGLVVGCAALHVMWEDLAEVRTLAVLEDWRRMGVGNALLESLASEALRLGVKRLFCLTFEVDFFARNGFDPIGSETVDAAVYAELMLSRDEGIAEFLDLSRVKPNTLGNTRMLKVL